MSHAAVDSAGLIDARGPTGVGQPGTSGIRVMLVQDEPRDLMIPAGAVAELIAADALQPSPPAAPHWLLGTCAWRGRRVPTVSLAPERLTPPRRLALARLAVCFTPSGHADLPYLAFYSRGLPRLERVTAHNLMGAPDQHPFALAAVAFGGLKAWIPDFDALEQALLEARSGWGAT